MLSQWIRQANWFMVYYISVIHIGAAIGLTRVTQAQYGTLALMLLFHCLSGLGITMGCHRLWAHRSYKAHGSVRFVLMLCTALANQGTIFHWSRDHRVHHKYSDTPADPHDSGRGFFFAHMGWLLLRKDQRVITAGNKLPLDDLLADWVVVLQQRLNPWGQLFMCFVVPTIVTVYAANETWLNALLLCGFLRYVTSLHVTWLVNSAAHFYGYRPYDPTIPPTENPIVAFLALGEGWHNWHHKFPYDYATSEFGITQQVNPTKLIIDVLAFLGLIWDRKRALTIWYKMQENKRNKALAAEKVVDPEGDDPMQAFSKLTAQGAT